MKHLRHVAPPDPPNANQIHENGLFLWNHHYGMAEEFDLLRDAA